MADRIQVHLRIEVVVTRTKTIFLENGEAVMIPLTRTRDGEVVVQGPAEKDGDLGTEME